MGLRINFNSAAIRSHYNLSRVDNLLEKTLERLSSGVRINSSADDPAGLTQANQIRHHLVGVNKAIENSEEGVAMLRSAEGSMDQISSMLIRMRELAVGAANGTADAAQLAAYQAEMDNAVGSITTTAEQSRFGSIRLLDGNLSDNTLSNNAKLFYDTLSHDDTKLTEGISEGSSFNIGAPSGNLTRSTVSQTFGANPGSATISSIIGNPTGDVITITGTKGSQNITLSNTMTMDQFVGLVNSNTSSTGARASYDATTGELIVESTNFGGGLNLENTKTSGAGNFLDSVPNDPATNANLSQAVAQTLDLDYTDQAGNPQTITLIQDPTSEDGLTFTDVDGKFSLALKDNSTGLMGSIITVPTTIETATRKSTAFFQIGSLQGQISNLEIGDMRAGALGRFNVGSPNISSIQDLFDGKALENGFAQEAITIIDAAIAEVSTSRARVGALSSNGMESTIDSLRVTAEALTSSESLIRDTDFALESAAYARHNIIFQAATAMLAQANQLPQSVLQLLQ